MTMTKKKQVTRRQLEANRTNSLRSTGPKSEAGKLAVRQNAITHGIFSSPAVLLTSEDERQRYEMLLSELHQEFRPQTVTERLECEMLAINIMRQRRLLAFEQAVAESHKDFKLAQVEKNRLERFHRSRGGDLEAEALEDITLELEETRAAHEAIEDFNSEPFVNVLLTLAIESNVDVAAILEVKEPFEAEWELRKQTAPKVFEALCEKRQQTADQVWQWLRGKIGFDLEKLQALYDKRIKQQRMAEAQAFLGSDSATTRIIKYEAHIQRQIERSLARLREAKK